MPLTDFAIVGFPKCGTTALAQILSEAPGFHIALGQDGGWEAPYFKTEGLLPPMMDGAVNGHKHAPYIYTIAPMKRLYEHNPNVLYILMVRPAVKALLSWRLMHQSIVLEGVNHQVNSTPEQQSFMLNASVEEYYAALPERRLAYAWQIEKLRHHVPGARIMVIEQERLAGDPAGVVRKLCEALNVPVPDAYLDELKPAPRGRGDVAAAHIRLDPALREKLDGRDRALRAYLASLPPETVLTA